MLCYNSTPVWWLGEELTPHCKKAAVTKCYTGPWNWLALVNTIMNLQVP